jgi:CheY-like chemotaxis protein
MAKRKNLNCILLIDDDKATNFWNEMVIKGLGINVKVTSVLSAQTGLDYLKANAEFSDRDTYPQPEIIFLDINMPAMNGWEFLKAFKTLPPRKSAPLIIVMLTTSLNPDDQKMAEEIDTLDYFLNKPLTEDKVMEIINKHFPEKA